MRRFVAVVALSAALLAACSRLIGPSFTRSQGAYLAALHQADNALISVFTDVELVEIGTQTCDAAAEGTINDATVVVAESLNQDAYDQLDEQLVTDYIRLVVVQALTRLCPAQRHWLNA